MQHTPGRLSGRPCLEYTDSIVPGRLRLAPRQSTRSRDELGPLLQRRREHSYNNATQGQNPSVGEQSRSCEATRRSQLSPAAPYEHRSGPV